MRVLVCGGRDYQDKAKVFNTLSDIALEFSTGSRDDEYGLPSGITIISGACSGADRLALDWAVVNWVPFHEFPAKWKEHGRAAGPIRNQQMIDEGKPDLVLAFPGGRGTENMVRLARKAGVNVRRVN